VFEFIGFPPKMHATDTIYLTTQAPQNYTIMKKRISLALIATTSSIFAANVYQIDFNTAGGSAGADWNVYSSYTDLVSSTTLTDTDSTSSSIFITASGDIDTSSGTGLYNDNGPSWLESNGAGDNAADDFFWTTNNSGLDTAQSFIMTFGGLTAGNEISLDLFASRSSSLVLTATYEYSLDGGTTWAGFTVLESGGAAAVTDGWDTANTQTQVFNLDENGGYEDGRYMNISGITLTESTLDVRVSVAADANYAGINAAQLTIVIPEPSTYAFLGGLLTLAHVVLRRRRS
jgi:hypothetical protein